MSLSRLPGPSCSGPITGLAVLSGHANLTFGPWFHLRVQEHSDWEILRSHVVQTHPELSKNEREEGSLRVVSRQSLALPRIQSVSRHLFFLLAVRPVHQTAMSSELLRKHQLLGGDTTNCSGSLCHELLFSWKWELRGVSTLTRSFQMYSSPVQARAPSQLGYCVSILPAQSCPKTEPKPSSCLCSLTLAKPQGASVRRSLQLHSAVVFFPSS